MYDYKEINGKSYIIHKETGCSLPYHSKANRYGEIPEYKLSYFRPWLQYSNGQRKKVKMNTVNKMFPCKPVTISAFDYTAPVTIQTDYVCWGNGPKQQEGINPMRYNDNYASASATVQAPKSDAAVQRDYLIQQLNTAKRTKTDTFQNLFNLYVDNTPKTYKDMIDAIKNDKFTVDPEAEKRISDWDTAEDGPSYFGPMYGIIWDGPKSDRDGYNAAMVEADKQKTVAERIIITGDAAAGLKALQDFEAWVPATGTPAN